MKKSVKGLLLFIAIVIVSFMVGSYILTATFFGILTLVGLIAIVESVSFIKYLVSISTFFVDIVIFVFTIIATMSYGLNIAASLTVAGLGYTLFYAPYLREQRQEKKKYNQTKFVRSKIPSLQDCRDYK